MPRPDTDTISGPLTYGTLRAALRELQNEPPVADPNPVVPVPHTPDPDAGRVVGPDSKNGGSGA
jgi:hypothetical protein